MGGLYGAVHELCSPLHKHKPKPDKHIHAFLYLLLHVRDEGGGGRALEPHGVATPWLRLVPYLAGRLSILWMGLAVVVVETFGLFFMEWDDSLIAFRF